MATFQIFLLNYTYALFLKQDIYNVDFKPLHDVRDNLADIVK